METCLVYSWGMGNRKLAQAWHGLGPPKAGTRRGGEAYNDNFVMPPALRLTFTRWYPTLNSSLLPAPSPSTTLPGGRTFETREPNNFLEVLPACSAPSIRGSGPALYINLRCLE